jgi:phage tail sheath protein FI
VQRALLRLCAARGDLFAVLALPEEYREDDAIAHMATLRSPLSQAIEVEASGGASIDSDVTPEERVQPLGYGESRAFSYGALYHPWLIERINDRPIIYQRTPPDGAACGILAQRALNRGAWIAPANELLRDVIALTPPLARERWLDLQIAQVNLVRQEPRGFVVLSADTLSNEGDLRPINVRRLLMLLRRLALRQGFTYVFEPNDDSFRRLVQRGFEAMLEQMFVRGAFAGPTPATSFQVVTSNTINTRQSVEQGRFIVELRVAPSLPMTFITIRLVQTHDRTFVTE